MNQAFVQALSLGTLQTCIDRHVLHRQICSVPTSSGITFGLPEKSETSVCGTGVGGNWFISGLLGLVGMCVSRELLKGVHWDHQMR